MESDLEHLAKVGNNIRKFRKSKGLTLQELAVLVDLSAPYLSQIENAHVNFSLGTLQKISQALNVPIVKLISYEENSSVKLIRAKNRKWYKLTGQAVESILLSAMENLEICQIILPPGEKTNGSDQHVSEEVCYVLKGTVQVVLNEENTYELFENDMIYYTSDIPHRWENNSSSEAEFLIINAPSSY